MKQILLTWAAFLCIGLSGVSAADKHDHSHHATPKGGRLLDKTEPHAEFVVEKDRTASIYFYDHDMKPVAGTTQTVTLIANAKTGRETIQFERRGDILVSKGRLPDGNGYNVVVQFRQTSDAKPVNLRFKLDLNPCAECKRAEYGCICEH